MGQASLYRFRTMPPRGLRILLLARERVKCDTTCEALRSDGHELIVVHRLTELAFAMDVISRGSGPCPDLLIVHERSWAAGVPEAMMWFGEPLQSVPVFVILSETAQEVLEHADVNVRAFGYPLDVDTLRRAVRMVETQRGQSVPRFTGGPNHARY